MTARPLEGVRVADLCWVGAGSYTTKILADQGADVIKIESSAKIDGLRLSPPFAGRTPGVNRSGYFSDRNTSKRGITLNLKAERGREIARDLIAVSDVVSNNFTPGVMAKFGLAYEDVRAFNPSAIYLNMSMQGTEGPERHYLGYGLTMGALVGLHHLTGIPGRSPVGTGTNYPDHLPNPCHGAFAVLAALRHRRRTGEGQMIDLAQTEPTIAALGPSILDYSVNGRDRGAQGNRHDRYAPHGVYPCRGEDRWIALAVTADQHWPALVDVLGLPEDQLDPAWRDEAIRRRDVEMIDALLAAATAGRDADALVVALQTVGVPAGQVYDAAGVVSDVQLAYREHWLRLDHPEMGRTLYNNVPFKLSKSPSDVQRRAPLLGEHTYDVCTELLGMSVDEVEGLIADEVLV